MRAAWDGIDAAKVWDAHAHLVGTGDSGSGITVNPAMDSLLDPAQYARRLFFLNAGCAHDAPGSVDRAYVERMRNLLDGMPGTKLLLFAFDRTYGEDGTLQGVFLRIDAASYLYALGSSCHPRRGSAWTRGRARAAVSAFAGAVLASLTRRFRVASSLITSPILPGSQ